MARKRRSATPALTDRERVLLAIIRGLETTMVLGRPDGHGGWCDHDGGPRAHFGMREPKPGDVVLCKTQREHSVWEVAYYVEPIPDGALLRAIGDDRLCRMTNECFAPLVGMRENETLDGADARFVLLARKAFGVIDSYVCRYGGVHFGEPGHATVYAREAFDGMLRGYHSVPIAVPMEYGKRTTLRSIVAALRAAGVGPETKFGRRAVRFRESTPRGPARSLDEVSSRVLSALRLRGPETGEGLAPFVTGDPALGGEATASALWSLACVGWAKEVKD